MKKHFTRKRAIIIFLFLAAAIVFNLPKTIMLFSGYCFEKGRYLADQEMFDIAAQEIANEKDIYISDFYYKTNEDGKKTLVNKKIKKYNYSSLEEFYAMNPNCCEFVGYVESEGVRMGIPCGKKINGQMRKFVFVSYVFGFNEDDDNKPVSGGRILGISNCGDKLWTRVDIIRLHQPGW